MPQWWNRTQTAQARGRMARGVAVLTAFGRQNLSYLLGKVGTPTYYESLQSAQLMKVSPLDQALHSQPRHRLSQYSLRCFLNKIWTKASTVSLSWSIAFA